MKQQLLVKYSNVRKKTFCQRLFGKKTPYTDLEDRMIVSNIPDLDIGNNKISTSKYHPISFPIFNLIEQFTKPSNIYFLIIGILQMIPAISVSEGKPTMFFPLVIVVLVSMVKDFFEDWKRRISDKKENDSEIEVLNEVGFSKTKWGRVMVGNIIKVHKDEYFPCDVMLLKHGQEAKMAFVETKNLDGQTNLKLKKVPQSLNFLQKEVDTELIGLQIEVMYEKPNPFINSFNGNIKMQDKKIPLEPNNIILRGCSLKINSYAIGLCLYNGHETKIMLNSGHSTPKRSSLQNGLNSYFKYICVFQIAVTLFCSLCYGGIVSTRYSSLGYILESPYFLMDTISAWGSWFISISNFIPISLLVTVQMIRYGQGFLLNKDPKCSTKGFSLEVQTSSVNEELGQIQYILTDKTGTLTQNLMEFKCISVGSRSYGQPTVDDRPRQNSMLTDLSSSMANNLGLPMQVLNRTPYVDFCNEEREKMLYDLKCEQQQDNIESSPIHKMLLHLALCHNVIKQGNQYTSSSPDELALVSFAKFMGYTFIQKDDSNVMKVQNGQTIFKFKLLHVLQFSSERKRMSVIVEDCNGNIHLLCKGADDVIMSRSMCSEEKKDQLNDHLYSYAFQGLRTLLVSQRQIERDEYLKWEAQYDSAITVISANRMEKIYDLQSQIQRNLTILGITAIQDKLQSEVKETIEELKNAGIKVWMLTGDKKETAVSIGYSCGLIDEASEKITLDCEPEHAQNLINNVDSMLDIIHGEKVTIVSGEILRKMKPETLEKLTKLLKQSSSVICCRVSPKDKQTLTRMVKNWGRTLAVGDGANDVNMINAANVGIGVRGIEGSQATRAADYVISEFKILKRLVIYYGLNYYYRNCNVTLYNLYKNILVTFPILAYGPLSLVSSTYIYETWVFQFFNIFYTSLPIIIFGLFNIKYSEEELGKNPSLYEHGKSSSYFNRGILVRLVVGSCLFGGIFVFVVYFCSELTILSNGYMAFQIWSGMLVFNIVVLSVNIRIFLICNQVSPALILAVMLSVLSYYLIFLLVETILYSDCKNVLSTQLQSPIFWLLLFSMVFLIEGFEWSCAKLRNSKGEKDTDSNVHSLTEEKAVEMKKSMQEIDSPSKLKKEQNIADVNGGYAFAQDQQRSMHFI